MKTGIITFHRSLNYGAVLQAYALHKAVEHASGGECAIIDYICQRMEYEYSLLIKTITEKQSKKISNIYKTLYIPFRIIRIYKFKRFLRRHVKQSETIRSKTELQSISKEFDKIITGSDQVWNPVHTDFDKAYFLDFVDDNKKKFSYAASFGFETIPDEMREEYYALLKCFKSISVREKKGSEIVHDLLGSVPAIVLDPTMLLDKQSWCSLQNKKMRYHYILLYTVGGKITEVVEFAEKLSKKEGLRILWVRAFIETKIHNCKKIYTAGPEDWITLFLNAAYIVTNTFHGTAFSINFNKQFYTALKPPPVINNSRLENILEVFGLQNRIITGNTDLSQEIDYTEVNKILVTEREKSLDFLNNILSGK